jgi:hypothetical protein
LLIGRRHNRQKKAAHRPEKVAQIEPVNPQSTAERLAAQHGVSPATVELLPLLEEQARERQAEAVANRHAKARGVDVEISPPLDAGKARDKAAAMVGTNAR